MPHRRHKLAPLRPTYRRVRVVRYRSIEGFLADYERNLSQGRLFVNCRRPLRVGDEVKLELALDRTAMRCRLSGRVRRVTPVGNGLNETPGMQVDLDVREPLAQLAAWCRQHNGASREPIHL